MIAAFVFLKIASLAWSTGPICICATEPCHVNELRVFVSKKKKQNKQKYTSALAEKKSANQFVLLRSEVLSTDMCSSSSLQRT